MTRHRKSSPCVWATPRGAGHCCARPPGSRQDRWADDWAWTVSRMSMNLFDQWRLDGKDV
jgi:hypothetical protein